jgi:hypothetical protein
MWDVVKLCPEVIILWSVVDGSVAGNVTNIRIKVSDILWNNVWDSVGMHIRNLQINMSEGD